MSKSTSMEEALMEVFTDHPNEILHLEDIYGFTQDYYELSENQREINSKYPQPNFHHFIRSMIARLKKQKLIKHVGRGSYRLNREEVI